MALETSQSFLKTKPKTPSLENAGWASTNRRMKKNASSTKIPAARTVSPSRRIRSGRRAAGARSSERAPAAVVVRAPASKALLRSRARDGLAVALEAGDLGLGLREHGRRQ